MFVREINGRKSRGTPVYLHILIFLSVLPLGAQEGSFFQETGIDPQTADPYSEVPDEEASEALGKTTLVPWSIDVLGKNYESFPNNEAARVLADWLVNSLIELKVFNVVNRDKIQAVLSEQQMAASGWAQDVSPNLLADAGKLLKVNYILFGNFKNLGKTSEVDFKLLDVNTTTYSHTVNFTIPFNPEIESMKPEIDRIVASLAAHFPVVAQIREIRDTRHLVIEAGTDDGLSDAMEVEMWRTGARSPTAKGFITRSSAMEAEVELDRDAAQVNLFDYVAHVKIVPPAQAALKKGLRDLEGGRHQAAATAFQKGLEADPDDGLLHANYARSLWRSGDSKSALEAFRRALALRPDDVELLEDVAAAMLDSGQIEELIDTLGQDGREASSLSLALYLGRAQEILGYPDRARDIFKDALRDDPNHGETHFRLAVLAAKRGELEEAEREFRLAEQGGGNSLEWELGLAAFKTVTNAPAEAKTRLTPLLERAAAERDFAALTSASEVLLVHQPLWGLSLELARQSLGMNPDYLRATLAAARAYAAGGQASQAVTLLNDALRAHPNSVALLLLSGELLAAERNYIEAESRFRQAQDLARDDWRPSDALGDIYSGEGDHLKAVRAYLEALERAEADGSVRLTPQLHKLGKSAVLANQHDTGRPYLERCVAGAPDNQECQYYLGLTYFQSTAPGDDERAVATFKAASDFPESAYYMGAIHERREQFEDALEWYPKCADHPRCEKAAESRARLDRIESMAGTVTAVRKKPDRSTLDIGRIHGVTHGLEGFVLHQGRVVGRVRIEEVQEKTSVAAILKGDPLVGQRVRFRPTRPKDLSVKAVSPKSVEVRWRSNPEPEVQLYEIYQKMGPRGSWQLAKKVKHPTSNLVDKSVKPGNTYYYKVVAVTETKTKSLSSTIVVVDTK